VQQAMLCHATLKCVETGENRIHCILGTNHLLRLCCRLFLQSMRDVVTRCLQKDPRLRPTAAQLLEHKFFKVSVLDATQLAKPGYAVVRRLVCRPCLHASSGLCMRFADICDWVAVVAHFGSNRWWAMVSAVIRHHAVGIGRARYHKTGNLIGNMLITDRQG
jgi:hypothetical protein